MEEHRERSEHWFIRWEELKQGLERALAELAGGPVAVSWRFVEGHHQGEARLDEVCFTFRGRERRIDRFKAFGPVPGVELEVVVSGVGAERWASALRRRLLLKIFRAGG